MTDRLLRIRTGRHPHEVLVLIASVVVGIVGLIVPTEVSDAVTHSMTSGLARFYYLGLAFFSAVALWGIFRHKVDGLLIERVAITVVALYYMIFAACVIGDRGLSGLMGIVIPVSYCIANLARCWQIRIDLALLRSYLADHPGEEVR